MDDPLVDIRRLDTKWIELNGTSNVSFEEWNATKPVARLKVVVTCLSKKEEPKIDVEIIPDKTASILAELENEPPNG